MAVFLYKVFSLSVTTTFPYRIWQPNLYCYIHSTYLLYAIMCYKFVSSSSSSSSVIISYSLLFISIHTPISNSIFSVVPLSTYLTCSFISFYVYFLLTRSLSGHDFVAIAGSTRTGRSRDHDWNYWSEAPSLDVVGFGSHVIGFGNMATVFVTMLFYLYFLYSLLFSARIRSKPFIFCRNLKKNLLIYDSVTYAYQ